MRAPAQRSCGAPVRQGDVTAVGPLRNRRGWLGTTVARVSVAPSSPVGAAPPAAFTRPDPGDVRIANRAWIARTRFRSENETQVSRPTWALTCANAGGRDRRRSGDLPLFRTQLRPVLGLRHRVSACPAMETCPRFVRGAGQAVRG